MGSKKKDTQSTPTEAPNSLISNSRLKILDLVCEGEIEGFWPQSGVSGQSALISTYFDEIPLVNPDGSANFNLSGQGFSYGYTFGTSGQSVIPGFEKIEVFVPLPQNTRIANPPAGGGDYKALITSFGTSQYPDADSIKLTMRVPSLFTQDDKGNTNGYQIQYAVDIALNGGSFIQQGPTYSINGKCTTPYLKTHLITLPKTTPAASEYNWKIRVRRVSTNILSIKTQNEIFVDSIAVVSTNSFRYPSSALVGIQLSAQQISSIPTRAYEIKGTKVNVPQGYTPTTYNTNGTVTAASYPGTWNGVFSTTKLWTDNPAWIFYDILSNNRYGLGDYFSSEWIDKWTLYAIAQYCDELVSNGQGGLEPRFTCNTNIQERQDAFNLIMSLASVFRGIAYWSNGRIFAIQDIPKSPIFDFTNASVVDGKFTYSDTARNTRSTVALVKWLNPANLYRETVEYIEDTDGILKYGYIEKEVSAFACISKGQAYRVGSWLLASEKLLTETVTFQVGMEGNQVRPGDVFNIYDNFRNNMSQGGRISGFDSARDTIVLDRPVNLYPGVSYTLSAVIPQFNLEATGDITSSSQIQYIRNSQIDVKAVTNTGLDVYTIELGSAFRTGLYSGAVWILDGNYSGVSGVFYKASKYKCLALSEPSKGVVEVLGLEYDTGVYSLLETGYSVISNPTNSGDNSPISPASNLTITPVSGLQSNNDFYFYLQLNWDDTPSTNLAYYEVSGQITGSAVQLAGTPTASELPFSTYSTGNHTFWVVAVSNGGLRSSAISNSYSVPTGNPLGGPPSLSGIYIAGNYDPLVPLTGYVGVEPTFAWGFTTGENGLEPPEVQFLDSYIIKFYNINTNQVMYQYQQEDPNITSITLNRSIITGFTGGAQRMFNIAVLNVDDYGNQLTGAQLKVNNFPPHSSPSASFYAGQGGISYSVAANPLDTDISGILIWYDTNPITPIPSNVTLASSNLAGFINANSGNYNIYYSIIDTFGFTGCPIYGPINVSSAIAVTGIKASGQSTFLNGGVILSGDGTVALSHGPGNTILLSSKAVPNPVTGISVTGGIGITGLVRFSGIGGAQVLQDGSNLVLVSGGAAESSVAVTGISITGGAAIINLVTFTGIGGTLVIQNGNTVSISGAGNGNNGGGSNAWGLSFCLDEPSITDGTGIAESIIHTRVDISGYHVTCQYSGITPITGRFYYSDVTNANKTTITTFLLEAGMSNSGLYLSPTIPFTGIRKIGYDLGWPPPTGWAKMSFGLFGNFV